MQIDEIEESGAWCNRRLRKCQVWVLESMRGWCYDDHDKKFVSARSAVKADSRKR